MNKVIITKEILDKGRSYKGSFNYDQLKFLGCKIPLKKGWEKRLLGIEVSEENVNSFLALKNKHYKVGSNNYNYKITSLGFINCSPDERREIASKYCLCCWDSVDEGCECRLID